MPTKIRIAHLAGPNATIEDTPPLVTSNKARAKYGLPLLTASKGPQFDLTCCGRRNWQRRRRFMSSSLVRIR